MHEYLSLYVCGGSGYLSNLPCESTLSNNIHHEPGLMAVLLEASNVERKMRNEE